MITLSPATQRPHVVPIERSTGTERRWLGQGQRLRLPRRQWAGPAHRYRLCRCSPVPRRRREALRAVDLERPRVHQAQRCRGPLPGHTRYAGGGDDRPRSRGTGILDSVLTVDRNVEARLIRNRPLRWGTRSVVGDERLHPPARWRSLCRLQSGRISSCGCDAAAAFEVPPTLGRDGLRLPDSAVSSVTSMTFPDDRRSKPAGSQRQSSSWLRT